MKSSVVGWAEFDPDAREPVAEIRLLPPQLIRAKLVDVNGEPVSGLELRVLGFGQAARIDGGSDVYLEDPPEGLRAWPAPVKTDEQGRFVLRGVGRGLYVRLVADDPRFGMQVLEVASDLREGPLDVTMTLKPAKFIEGRVVAGDTDQPISGAVISVASSRVYSDANGRFRANPTGGDRLGVLAYPPDGHPYLIAATEVAWTRGRVKKHLDIRLPRGVVIRGKVTEQGTGRPLAGSSVLFVPIDGPLGVATKWDSTVPSQSDGSFRIVVPPGKGHLLVFGPTSDYIHEVIGSRMLTIGRDGGERWYAHRIIPYEVSAGDSPRTLTAELRPGKTIRGRVVDVDDQPVLDAMIITRLHIEPFNPFWRGDWSVQHRARDGYFELHGLDPKNSVLVYFFDAEHNRGAAVELSGDQPGEDLTIRLDPTGQARARFVGPDDKPVAVFLCASSSSRPPVRRHSALNGMSRRNCWTTS